MSTITRQRKETVGHHWRNWDGLYYLIAAFIFYAAVALIYAK